MSKWVMQAHLRHLRFNIFLMIKKFFNLMGCDPCNYSLKILESIGTPTPQVGVVLGVWGFILSNTPTLPGVRCVSQAFFLSHILASPCLGREPKARVVTHNLLSFSLSQAKTFFFIQHLWSCLFERIYPTFQNTFQPTLWVLVWLHQA